MLQNRHLSSPIYTGFSILRFLLAKNTVTNFKIILFVMEILENWAVPLAFLFFAQQIKSFLSFRKLLLFKHFIFLYGMEHTRYHSPIKLEYLYHQYYIISDTNIPRKQNTCAIFKTPVKYSS